jgi:hypothetical protein
VKLRRDQPAGHEPTETRVNTVKVECKRTGPEQVSEYDTYRQYTLADAEAWTAELRRLGAPDDLVLREADGLTVTVDVSHREPQDPGGTA